MINFTISPLDLSYLPELKNTVDNKTKPLGSLGQLESLAIQLGLIQSQPLQRVVDKISLHQPTILVFAGDHGIAKHGVSIAPSSVTRQMVLNFLAGGAAINCFCRINNITLKIIDAGIIEALTTDEIGACKTFFSQRIAAGTNDFTKEPAMTLTQVNQGLAYGASIALQEILQGCNLLMLGEMGIANTSSASAIMALLLDTPSEICVGQGTGITSDQLLLKQQLVKQAITRVTNKHAKEHVLPITKLSPQQVMAEVGGFEIVQMVGAILASAQAQTPVLIDGFIVSVAALIAVSMHTHTKDYLIFSHQSDEQAHQLILAQLDAKPLLNLALRLGEGTGAALALPLLTAAVSFYNDMASFESAGVTV
ncbi:nicotinate-nucleotide--dimethylbenzimidazole phosphoribosyltransferase [Thalassotalea piscium]|uniref:Nicotinate-nucleotide--dimethylbenzimidazole phosphoribosyltransferase n=1 Tax=Thalassotalea piscium TaxID=1230533 RepID=A0A7X0TV19_9GAMM|nr:nicotinate-nucleotide--dimethylbenzimidazole phosphoribosyltransferase [Thalassotalea piscium]MBB6544982.1 nicotinate-nucleotide--dimethylbenzimidazole phosphoribosyltransferase [Thalassotalea piscium]